MSRRRGGSSGPPTPWLVGAVGLIAAGTAAVTALLRPFTPPRPPDTAGARRPRYTPDAARYPLISPFHLDTEPMRALALFNFERDSDEVYKGLEPQAFDDEVHGRGLIVIGWRVDGRVDVFHEPGLRLDPANYAIAGAGLHRLEPRELGRGRFEIGPNGLEVDLSFTDLEGRPIRLLAEESDTRPRRPFALLAPMGTAATDPPALPLVYVKDFYFVRRAGSQLRIEIDGRVHHSDTLPLFLDATRMHFVRYSARPLIALWNHHRHTTVDVLAPDVGTDDVPRSNVTTPDGSTYVLRADGPVLEIERMTRHQGEQSVAVTFTPPFPHLLALTDDAVAAGGFEVTTDPPAGSITGTWRVTRRGRSIEIEVVPSGGWTPGEAQPMARLLFRLIRMFRSWPTTYRWEGTVEVPADQVDHPPALRAEWERTG